MNKPTQKYFSTIRVGNRKFDIAYIKSLIYVTNITTVLNRTLKSQWSDKK